MIINRIYENPYTGLDRASGFPEFDAPRFPYHSAHEGGKVVSIKHRPPLPPRRYRWYSFLLAAESTTGPWCTGKENVCEGFQ
jgi:hypothetical protein